MPLAWRVQTQTGAVWVKIARADSKLNEQQKKKPMTKMSEVAAALMIQRVLRGKEGRERAKKLRLWKVWNMLDTKEENELVKSFDQYEELKSAYEDTKTAMAALPVRVLW